jgi:hypothetical protein
MTDRRTQPQQQSSIVATAAFFLVIVMADPALAASGKQLPCPNDVLVSDLEFSVQALVTDLASNDISGPSTSLLAPLAEAAIREAFDESDSALKLPETNFIKAAVSPSLAEAEVNPAVSPDNEKSTSNAGPVPDMNTRLPGVSDGALSRYRKQMYRRDI